MTQFSSYSEAKAAGAKRYFTGNPCKAGHISERFTSVRHCVTCLSENRSRWKRKPEERARAQRNYLSNPEKRAAHVALTRARRQKSVADIGRYARKRARELFILQRGRCVNCACSLGEKWEVDHYMPLALGGTDDDSNLQLLCRPCNRKKSAIHPIEFANREGRLL